MSVTVRIPTPLRSLAGGAALIEVEGGSVSEVLDHLESCHCGLKVRILDDRGELRRFVNVFLNDEDVRQLAGLETPVRAGDVLAIIPAIAGGNGYRDWLAKLKSEIPEIEPEAAQTRRQAGAVLVDVREGDEQRAGHAEGALLVPKGYLELRIEQAVPDKGAELVLYCAGGVRSMFAADTLRRMGYRRVSSMAGGFGRWKDRGLPVRVQPALSEEQRRRYARHLTIPEVGEAGQLKLLSSKVLLLGAGGLGCPAALYLAAAGVGTLGIVDFDTVDESNLQRQILHPTSAVGQSKTESARKALLALNPGVKVMTHEERLTSRNVEAIFRGYDLVVDGSDNFPTRYLVNDACILLGLPCVHGSVYRFEGQVTVFAPARGGPCYRCLYPEPPPPELAPSCAEAGVLGVLPGVIGLLEAVEAIKLLLGRGKPLIGRLLAYDALAASFQEYRLQRDPACAYCASGATFPGFVDYEFFCASAATRHATAAP